MHLSAVVSTNILESREIIYLPVSSNERTLEMNNDRNYTSGAICCVVVSSQVCSLIME